MRQIEPAPTSTLRKEPEGRQTQAVDEPPEAGPERRQSESGREDSTDDPACAEAAPGDEPGQRWCRDRQGEQSHKPGALGFLRTGRLGPGQRRRMVRSTEFAEERVRMSQVRHLR